MVKVFKYKGKTLEELQKMSRVEFAQLVPIRRKKSLLKGPTPKQKRFLQKIKLANEGKYKKNIKTHCRNLIITPDMVNLLIHIHNGKSFDAIKIQPEMIAHTLGEFTYNRKRVTHSSPGIGATRSSASASVK